MKEQPTVMREVTPEGTFDAKRQLHGTAFLSLEHWAYMILVVAVPLLLLGGFQAALAIWTNKGEEPMMSLLMQGMGGQLAVSAAVVFTAALVTLAPLLFVLERRTHSEFSKRPNYRNRLAYKLPIYGALALLAILKIAAFISLVAVFLESLALIGVKGADIGNLYLTQFLPSLLALLVFGATSWYVFKLAKGIDKSRLFAFAILWLGALVAVTLFTTAVMAAHKEQENKPSSPYSMPMPNYMYE